MKTIHLKIGSQEFAIRASFENGELTLRDEKGRDRQFKIRERNGELIIDHESRTDRLFVFRNGEDVWVSSHGEPYAGRRFHPEAGVEDTNDATSADIVAPMNGRVVSVLVELGQNVAEGDGIVVVEAMKMEHKLVAPFAATVDALNCEEGHQVEMNQILAHLVRIEQADDQDS